MAGYKLPDDLHSSVDVLFPQKKAENNLFRSPAVRGQCILDSSSQLFAALNLLQKQNVLRIIAEPTLIAVSNQRGDFCSGGDFPVPSPQSGGATTIEWKKYGTEVSFLPIVLADNKIRLNCHVEISELDENHGITVAGMKVPGLCSRSVATTTELRSGQTLVVAGLVQTRAVADSDQSDDSAAEKTPPINEKTEKTSTAGKSRPAVPQREVAEKYETLFLLTPEIVEAGR